MDFEYGLSSSSCEVQRGDACDCFDKFELSCGSRLVSSVHFYSIVETKATTQERQERTPEVAARAQNITMIKF